MESHLHAFVAMEVWWSLNSYAPDLAAANFSAFLVHDGQLRPDRPARCTIVVSLYGMTIQLIAIICQESHLVDNVPYAEESLVACSENPTKRKTSLCCSFFHAGSWTAAAQPTCPMCPRGPAGSSVAERISACTPSCHTRAAPSHPYIIKGQGSGPKGT